MPIEKTLQQLLDEYAKLYCVYWTPNIEERMDINPLSDRMDKIIFEIESLIRKETIEDILGEVHDVAIDDRFASPLFGVTREDIEDYAQAKGINLK